MIAQRLFQTAYQPIFSMQRNMAVGYEALTRFEDGTSPEAMFSAAKKYGLSLQMETATLATAVETAGTCLPPDCFVSVNVPPDHLLNAQEDILRILSRAKRGVVLEVTEHEAVTDYVELRAALAEFPARVAIDDVGTGYASLQHVASLGPSFVKLDQLWSVDIDGNPAHQAVIECLNFFTNSIGATLIAEGIETDRQLRYLRGLQVPLGQGYLFGRPILCSDLREERGAA